MTLSIVLSSALIGTADARAATTVVLSRINTSGAITAYGGYVLWSRQLANGRWQLMRLHGGRVAAPTAVATREVPFDVDAGPDGRGRAVALYSRCVIEPNFGPRFRDMWPVWSESRGCHIHQLDLASGRDRVLRSLVSGVASDTTPTRWVNRIVFARRSNGRRAPTLMVLSGGRLAALPGGDVSQDGRSATVASMDLGGTVLGYVWEQPGPTWQVRGDRLARGGLPATSEAVAEGELSGTCGSTQPAWPNVRNGVIAFLYFVGSCTRDYEFVGEGARVVVARPDGGALGQIAIPPANGPIPFSIATDGPSTYWVRDWRRSAHGFDDCSGAASRCSLMRGGVPRV